MAQPFVGEIRLFAGNFAPKGWAMCDGSSQAIGQHEELYELIGTTYGGDGVKTFNLPDLRGRVPIHASDDGNTRYFLGEMAGVEHVALTINEYPTHSHAAVVSSAQATQPGPGGNLLAAGAVPIYSASTTTSATATLNPGAVAPVIGGESHGNLQPLLVLTYIIALVGVRPES